jgi:hypothetical protein
MYNEDEKSWACDLEKKRGSVLENVIGCVDEKIRCRVGRYISVYGHFQLDCLIRF